MGEGGVRGSGTVGIRSIKSLIRNVNGTCGPHM